MNIRNLFSIVMVTAVLLTACAPQPVAAPEAPPTQAQVSQPEATAEPTAAAAAPEAAPAPVAVATSRGDKLEATDPSTVALASGGLQLVEVFRFT